MTDTTDSKPKLGIVNSTDTEAQTSAESTKVEESASKLSPEEEGIQQLRKFRNLKLYLDQMIGKQWLLMYRREEDGIPVFVPNDYLTPEDQVFFGELAKHLVFSMMGMVGEGDI